LFVSPELVNSFVARGSYDVVAQVCSKSELLENFASREEALEAILKRARKDGYFYKIIADNLKALKPRKISEGTGVPHQLVADIVNLLESFVYNKINESELLNRLQRFQEKTLENPTLYMVLAGADKEIRKLVKKYQAKVEERIQQQKASQLHSRIMKDPLPYEKFVEPKLVQAALRLLDDVMKKHWSPMEKESMEDILSDLRKPHSCKEIFDQLTRKITVVVQ
jgi:hypothetical protein